MSSIDVPESVDLSITSSDRDPKDPDREVVVRSGILLLLLLLLLLHPVTSSPGHFFSSTEMTSVHVFGKMTMSWPGK